MPSITAVLMARPTKSTGLYTQVRGRGSVTQAHAAQLARKHAHPASSWQLPLHMPHCHCWRRNCTTARQMLGRGLRKLPGKEDCLVLVRARLSDMPAPLCLCLCLSPLCAFTQLSLTHSHACIVCAAHTQDFTDRSHSAARVVDLRVILEDIARSSDWQRPEHVDSTVTVKTDGARQGGC